MSAPESIEDMTDRQAYVLANMFLNGKTLKYISKETGLPYKNLADSIKRKISIFMAQNASEEYDVECMVRVVPKKADKKN